MHDLFKANTADVAAIMAICFSYQEGTHTTISVEALNCFTVGAATMVFRGCTDTDLLFQAWVTYAHNTWSSDPVSLQLLQVLTPAAARYLYSNIDDLRDPAIELFVSILEYRLKFLQREDLELISSLVRTKLGPLCVEACSSGQQSADIVTLSKLVAAYGKATVKDIVARRGLESSAEIVGK